MLPRVPNGKAQMDPSFLYSTASKVLWYRCSLQDTIQRFPAPASAQERPPWSVNGSTAHNATPQRPCRTTKEGRRQANTFSLSQLSTFAPRAAAAMRSRLCRSRSSKGPAMTCSKERVSTAGVRCRLCRGCHTRLLTTPPQRMTR